MLDQQVGENPDRAVGAEIVFAVGFQAAEKGTAHVGLAFRNAALARLHAALLGDGPVDRVLHHVARRGQAIFIGVQQAHRFAAKRFGALEGQFRITELAARFMQARPTLLHIRVPGGAAEAAVFGPVFGLLEQRLVTPHVSFSLIEIAELDVGVGDLAVGVEEKAL